MKLRRKYIFLILLTMVLTAIVGCSNSSSGSNDTTEVKMVFWPGPESDAMQKVVEEYNKTQGKEDGVNVEMLLISRDGTYEKEATMMSSKSDEVDMYFTASYIVGQHAPYLEALDDDLNLDNYLDPAIDSLKVDGETLAIPTDAATHFLLYREDLIEELLTNEEWQEKYRELSQEVLGSEVDPKHPDDWNWDDFIAMSAFFTKEKNDLSPTKYGTALQLKNLIMNVFLWDNILWSEGGGWFDEEERVTINSEPARKAMEVYSEVFTNKFTSPDSSVAEFPEAQAAMSSGNAAFIIQWSAAFDELNDPDRSPETAGKIGVAPVPGKQAHVQGQGIGLNKYSNNKEASLKWMEYLTTSEANELYAESGGITAMAEVMEASDKEILGITSEFIGEYGYAPPTLPETNKIIEILADNLSGGWVGERDINEALDKSQEEIEKLLEK